MPDGVVQWFDQDAGEGRVLHRRRRYAVAIADIEPAARVPGARVHFDIDHQREGTWATDVILRAGTRHSPGHGRFGDVQGADALPGAQSADAQDTAPNLARAPRTTVEWWAQQLAAGDLDALLSVYAPTAVLQVGDEAPVVGPDAIRGWWADSPLLGGPGASRLRGDGDGDGRTFLLRWVGAGLPGAGMRSRITVDRGEIVEQHVDPVNSEQATAEAAEELALSVEVSVDGEVSTRHRERAVERIAKALERNDRPVLHARIRLVQDPQRGGQPASAKVSLLVDGRPVRADVAAADLDAAIDALTQRLGQQLDKLAGEVITARRRGPGAEDGEWRRGDLPTDRPDHHPRPAAEREVVRHKTYTTPDATLDEAIEDMEALDYRFFLFTDLGTGQEACVERLADGPYRVRAQEGASESDDAFASAVAAVEIDPSPAAVRTLESARELLDVGPDEFVFYTDAETGRGRLLYRRYDGHYGLITPR